MKKILFYIFIAASLLMMASCNGFLDKYPSYAVDPEGEVTDSMAIALTNACYKTLQSSNMYNMRLWSLDIIAGNSVVGGGGGTDGLETIQASNFVANSDNGMALYLWRSPWVGIGRCNIVLQSLPSASINESLKKRSLGEAYFLRAHYYYVLVRLFGGVPLRLEPYVPGESTAIARKSLEECYYQIIEDCQNAIDRLPAKSTYGSDDLGRATKDAALTMLADVYLTIAPKNFSKYPTQTCYKNVVDLCNQVTALGYNLSKCTYASNFDAKNPNGPESIFEVQFSGSTEYDFWGGDCQSSWLSTFMGPRNSGIVAGCYGWNLPTSEFVNQYESGDLRKDLTILYAGCPDFDGNTYKASWSSTGYNVRKFLVTKSVSPEYNTSPLDFVVYRYAHVLLMQAEALNEQNQTSEAATYINKVRSRAGLGGISPSVTQEEMRNDIIHERRIEFAFEGYRWFDLIRIGDGTYAVNFLHSIGKTNATKERLLFPIPQTERDANPLMDQNPGY